MKREFLLNIVFLLGINLLIKPFFIFGIDRTVQNIVGPEEYGIYAVLLSLLYMVQVVNDLGLRSFNNRTIAQHPHLLDKLFGRILGLKVVLAIAYALVLVGIAYVMDYRSPREQFILGVLWFNQVLVSITLYFRTNISGLGLYQIDSIISALDKFLMILLVGALILFRPQSVRIEFFILGQTIALLLTSGIAFLVVKNRLVLPLKIRFDPTYFRSLLRQSFPFALIILLTSIYTRIDSIMLEQLIGYAEAGVYAAAYRLLDAVNMIGFLFAGLLLPIFSKMLKQRQPVGSLVRTSAQLIWAGAIPLAVAAVVFRVEIMQLLYDEATPVWGDVLAPLILSFVAVCGNYIYGTLLTANGNLRRMNILFAVSIPINALLNAYLIPRFGAAGASWATFVTQFMVMLAQIELARREVGLRFAGGMILRLLSYVGALAVSGYCLSTYPMLDWRLGFFGLLLGSGLLAMVFGLIEWRNALRYLRER